MENLGDYMKLICVKSAVFLLCCQVVVLLIHFNTFMLKFCYRKKLYFVKFYKNYKVFPTSHLINTRLVCTHLNAFLMLYQNMSMKILFLIFFFQFWNFHLTSEWSGLKRNCSVDEIRTCEKKVPTKLILNMWTFTWFLVLVCLFLLSFNQFDVLFAKDLCLNPISRFEYFEWMLIILLQC